MASVVQQPGKRNRKFGRNKTRSQSMLRYKAENRSEKNRIKKLQKLLETQPKNKQIVAALGHAKQNKVRI